MVSKAEQVDRFGMIGFQHLSDYQEIAQGFAYSL